MGALDPGAGVVPEDGIAVVDEAVDVVDEVVEDDDDEDDDGAVVLGVAGVVVVVAVLVAGVLAVDEVEGVEVEEEVDEDPDAGDWTGGATYGLPVKIALALPNTSPSFEASTSCIQKYLCLEASRLFFN